MSTTKYIVDNKPEQEIDGDLEIRGDLAISGEVTITGNTNIRPYKVYTALLTQTGGDDPQQVISDGTVPGVSPPPNIIKGVTYTISSNTDGDFTQYGAPDNNVGTSFVATQNAGYYTATFELDYNNGAPVATVLENTIGNITWTYSTTGTYRAILVGAFTVDKTAVLISSQGSGGGFGIVTSASIQNFPDQIVINTQSNLGGIDGNLQKSTIEIRVYN